MIQSVSGIILHTTNYSDTSLIARVYTRELGLISCIVSGVRSRKSKQKASLFQPLALAELVISGNARNNLYRITEINISHPYSSVPYDFVKSSVAIFLNEVVYRSVKEDHADPDLYEFLKSSLMILDLKTESTANFHISFMTKLSRYLGFGPQGTYMGGSFFDLREGRFVSSDPSHAYCLDPALASLLNHLLLLDYERIQELKIDKLQRRKLLQGMIDYYRLHIPSFGEIRSKEIFEVISG